MKTVLRYKFKLSVCRYFFTVVCLKYDIKSRLLDSKKSSGRKNWYNSRLGYCYRCRIVSAQRIEILQTLMRKGCRNKKDVLF